MKELDNRRVYFLPNIHEGLRYQCEARGFKVRDAELFGVVDGVNLNDRGPALALFGLPGQLARQHLASLLYHYPMAYALERYDFPLADAPIWITIRSVGRHEIDRMIVKKEVVIHARIEEDPGP